MRNSVPGATADEVELIRKYLMAVVAEVFSSTDLEERQASWKLGNNHFVFWTLFLTGDEEKKIKERFSLEIIRTERFNPLLKEKEKRREEYNRSYRSKISYTQIEFLKRNARKHEEKEAGRQSALSNESTDEELSPTVPCSSLSASNE